MDDTSVLSLPWQIQLALGSGYAAYMTAYAGTRGHHTAVDITFRTLVFSIVTTSTILILGHYIGLVSIPFAIATTIAAGVIWRVWARSWFKRILRDNDVTWADDTPAAWLRITAENSTYPVSQLAVEMEDGGWLVCSNLSNYTDFAFGPCTFGLNGDVAMYADQEIDPTGTVTNNTSIRAHDGDRVTYIPANRIKRVSIRHAKP